jgi:hypothetical protein
MTEAEYRAHPALNYSLAKHLLDSPAHFAAAQQQPVVPTAAMILGTLVHGMVLEGKKPSDIAWVKPDGLNLTTTAGKLWKAEITDDRPLVSHDDAETASHMAEAIEQHEMARDILLQASHREMPIIAEMKGIECKGKLDACGSNGRDWAIVDIKTTQKAGPRDFSRSVVDGRYDMQAAWYQLLLAKHFELEERPEFFWIAVEKTPPYVVAVHTLDAAWMEEGLAKVEMALARYERCMDTGVWEKPYDGINTLTKPTWA